MKLDIAQTSKAIKKVSPTAIRRKNITMKNMERQLTQHSNKIQARAILERQAELMKPEDYIRARAYLADAERAYFANENFIF